MADLRIQVPGMMCSGSRGSSRTLCLNSSFTESIDEFDLAITKVQHHLSTVLPRSHSRRYIYVVLLAWLQ